MNEGSGGNKFDGADVERERVNAPKRHSAGFTLVELLVVIAIVALVAGIAVPGMARLLGYGKDNVGSAARDVYTMLRAANIYAATFRVNTAVVYAVGVRTDSVSGEPALVIDGIGMARARAFNAEEIQRLKDEGRDTAEIESNPGSVYVLVQGDDGHIRPLPPYSCVQPLVTPAAGVFASTIDQFEIAMEDKGMRPIILFGEERVVDDITGAQTSQFTRITPRSSIEYEETAALTNVFPAHVFSPTGTMVTAGTLGARFVLPVGFAPDADPEDRFVSPDYDSETGGLPMDPINVELYPATGRVKIAS